MRMLGYYIKKNNLTRKYSESTLVIKNDIHTNIMCVYSSETLRAKRGLDEVAYLCNGRSLSMNHMCYWSLPKQA